MLSNKRHFLKPRSRAHHQMSFNRHLLKLLTYSYWKQYREMLLFDLEFCWVTIFYYRRRQHGFIRVTESQLPGRYSLPLLQQYGQVMLIVFLPSYSLDLIKGDLGTEIVHPVEMLGEIRNLADTWLVEFSIDRKLSRSNIFSSKIKYVDTIIGLGIFLSHY